MERYRIELSISGGTLEGSHLPSKRNSPKSERIENAPLAVLISTEQLQACS